jgi:hypothetical protein
MVRTCGVSDALGRGKQLIDTSTENEIMSAYATFYSTDRSRDGWDARIRISGTLEVYSATGRPARLRWAPSVEQQIDRIGDAVLDYWNSMPSITVDRGRHRYLLYFELRVVRGRSPVIQEAVNFDQWRDVQDECVDDHINVIVLLNRIDNDSAIWGSVPQMGPGNVPSYDRVEHQPYSDVIKLTKNQWPYTIGHEVGHVLGLGEGYRLTEVFEEPDPSRPDEPPHSLGYQYATIPGDEGTPMARLEQAGRTLNQAQRNALLGYCLGARAAARRGRVTGRDYGPRVLGYRAREEGTTP